MKRSQAFVKQKTNATGIFKRLKQKENLEKGEDAEPPSFFCSKQKKTCTSR